MHVILMSATLNAELFSQYFDAPAIMVNIHLGFNCNSGINNRVIQVPGKMFDVKIMYTPNEKDDKNLVDENEYRKRQSQEIKVEHLRNVAPN